MILLTYQRQIMLLREPEQVQSCGKLQTYASEKLIWMKSQFINNCQSIELIISNWILRWTILTRKRRKRQLLNYKFKITKQSSQSCLKNIRTIWANLSKRVLTILNQRLNMLLLLLETWKLSLSSREPMTSLWRTDSTRCVVGRVAAPKS